MNSSSLWIRDFNLLKIKWKVLEKECQLFFKKYSESDISIKDLFDFHKTYNYAFSVDSQNMKNDIFKFRRIVKKLNDNKSFTNLPKQYRAKLDVLKNDMETNIKTLNEKIIKNIENLLNEERYLSLEISIINSQLEMGFKRDDFKPKFISKSSIRYDEFSNVPEEVSQFDRYLQMHEGHNAGWTDKEHSIFLRLRKLYKGKSEFLEELSKYITNFSWQEILKHEEWYIKYLQLLEAKKSAINKWKESQRIKNISAINSKDLNAVLDTEHCVKSQENNLNQVLSSDIIVDKDLPNHYLILDNKSGANGVLNQMSGNNIPCNLDSIKNLLLKQSHIMSNDFPGRFVEDSIKQIIPKTLKDEDAIQKENDVSSWGNKNIKAVVSNISEDRKFVKEKIQHWKNQQLKLKQEKEDNLILKCNQDKELELLKLQKQNIEREKLAYIRHQQMMESEKIMELRREEEERMSNAKKQFATQLANQSSYRELEKFKEKKKKEIMIRDTIERQKIERLEKIKNRVSVSTTRDPKRYMRPTISWMEKEKSPPADDAYNDDQFDHDIFSLPHKHIPHWRQEIT